MADESEMIEPGEYIVTVHLRDTVKIDKPTRAGELVDVVMANEGCDVDFDID